MIEWEQHAGGVILPVRAQAGARQNGLKGIHAGALQVCVTQAPEKGKANKAIVAVLADQLELRKNQIELLAGETSPRKRFLVREVSLETLAARIAQALADK